MEHTVEERRKRTGPQGWELPHLRSWRQVRGLTQVEVARRAGIGLSTLSRLESQRQRASWGMVTLLAGALGVERDTLMHQSAFRGVEQTSD